MASFSFSEDQEMLVDALRKYAANHLAKNAHEHDEESFIPHEVILKGWEIGLLPASLPEAYGGFGDYSAITNAIALEELAYGDMAGAMKLMTPALFAYPVLFYGTEEQKARFLPMFAEEKPYPVTAALVEPRLDFDPHDLQSSASPDGDGFILNGVKAYVPLAEGAEWVLVYARHSESGSIDGYLVETSQVEGFSIEQREKLMGLRGLECFRLKLNNVRVDAGCRLGGEAGSDYARLLAHSDVALTALATGVARASYEYARDYAKSRVQFGKAIATKQAVAFMLAEAAIEVDSMRLMAWEAAWQIDNNSPTPALQQSAALARHYANDAALKVADIGVQTLGGHGFIREHPVERYLRNMRGLPMFTGLALV